MSSLYPVTDARYECPRCGRALDAAGWLIPGMRILADLRCRGCGASYYGDLPTGHALLYPTLLDCKTGRTIAGHAAPWFADWLEQGYARRVTEAPPLRVERLRPVRTAILLDCLDALYGHTLLKLLGAQQYLDQPGVAGLVVLVPQTLRWLVPDGVAEVWTVDLPLSRGTEWNDGLAAALDPLVRGFDSVSVAAGLPHPHPDDVDIERFSRVSPFPLAEWGARLADPTVTFAWREDRVWESGSRHRLTERGPRSRRAARARQERRVEQLAAALRAEFPRLRLAVAGLGEAGGLDARIDDRRSAGVDDELERSWCRLYAESHVVVGVHGSNLLLPSAHAGAVVDLMPEDRWGNALQDLLVRGSDAREAAFRTRLLPLSTGVSEVAAAVAALLADHEAMRVAFAREWTTLDPERLRALPDARERARRRG